MARALLLLALLAAAPLGAQKFPTTDSVAINRSQRPRTIMRENDAAVAAFSLAADTLELYRAAVTWALKEDSTVGLVSFRDTSFQRRYVKALGGRQDSMSLGVAIRVPGRKNWPSRAYLLEPRITADTATMLVLLQQPLGMVVQLRSKKDESRWFTQGFKLTLVRASGRWLVYNAELFAIS